MKRSGLPVPRRAGGPGALGGAARSSRGWGSGLPTPLPWNSSAPTGSCPLAVGEAVKEEKTFLLPTPPSGVPLGWSPQLLALHVGCRL